MTQTPASAPEDESVTDYLLRKVSKKKSPSTDTVIDLDKTVVPNVTPADKPEGGGALVNIIIVMMMVGIIAAIALPVYAVLAGK